ncbi:MAG TPA: hypothetical protein VHE35_29425 [Kofleriaceae bacterium]|nr:hypothetical protein [Kofleriaceae bacterium]
MSRELFWGEQSAAALADVVRTALQRAQAKPEVHFLRTAFENLVRFHERQLVTGELDEAQLAQFRADVDAALRPLVDLVRDWAIDVKNDAQSGREEDRFDTCRNRSAMAFLLADHADVPELDEIREDVELVDDELHRMCESYGPISDEHQPRGLPADHWWWRCTGDHGG